MKLIWTLILLGASLLTCLIITTPDTQNQGIYLIVAGKNDAVSTQLTAEGLLLGTSISPWEVVYDDGEHVKSITQNDKYRWWQGPLPNKQMTFKVVSDDSMVIGGTDSGRGKIVIERSLWRILDTYWYIFVIYIFVWIMLMFFPPSTKRMTH